MSQRELSLFLKPSIMKHKAKHGSEITRRFTMNGVGRMIAAALQDKTVRLYDARNCEEMQCIRDDYLTTAIAFSPKGDVVATGNVGRSVKIWDIRTGSCLATLDGHSYPVLSLSFSPDGDRLVSASGDTTLKIWGMDNYQEHMTLKGHTLYVKACEWDPSGNRIISASVDSTIREWDLSSGKTIAVHNDHRTAIHVIRFNRDGSLLASGSSDMTIILWDASSSELKPVETLFGHQAEVRALSFSSDGKHIASGSSDKELFVWTTDTYSIQGESRTDGEIDGIEWYPTGSAFLSSDGSGAIIKWEVKDMNEMLRPFQELLDDINSDPELTRRDEFVHRFEEIQSQYDDETLRDKRLFYIQWQCKKALGLLKGKTRRL